MDKTEPLPPALKTELTRAGWRLSRQSLSRAGRKIFCAVERAEPRRAHLEGALAVAILKARSSAPRHVEPLAVVCTSRLSPRLEAHLSQFVARHAPGVAWGIVDDFDRVVLQLGELSVDRPARPRPRSPSLTVAGELFSDLNQWLVKVLLSHRFPDTSLRCAQRGPFRNASVLAVAADVSLPVVTRFLRRLRVGGMLETGGGYLELMRIPELLEGVRYAAARGPRAEYAVRLEDGSSTPYGWMQASLEDPSLRATFGLFDAARLLGIAHVANAPVVVYLGVQDSQVTLKLLRQLGLIPVAPGSAFDLVVRVPRFPESLFRASVARRDGELSDELINRYTDVLQTWADLSHHPARGRELAETLWNELIAPSIGSHD